eukprot:11924829-Prorocentrum_lima.AAC.1
MQRWAHAATAEGVLRLGFANRVVSDLTVSLVILFFCPPSNDHSSGVGKVLSLAPTIPRPQKAAGIR